MPLIRVLRAVLRILRLGLHVIAGLLLSVVVPWCRPQCRVRLIRRWLARVPGLLGVQVDYPDAVLPSGSLWVANHSSWLDIPILGGMADGVVFLSKAQIQRWPVVGLFARVAGTVFIERGHGAGPAIDAIAQGLQAEKRIMVFPEGTTTDGLTVRRFHSRLFKPVVEQHRCVQPVALRFYDDAPKKRTTLAAYTDNQKLIASLWRVVMADALTVSVTVLEPIWPDEQQPRPRDHLAQSAQAAIKTVLATEK